MKRIIPTINILNGRAVKTVNFKNPNYLGDPLNIVEIFDSYEADEIFIIDIGASKSLYPIDFELLNILSQKVTVPITYAGGIKTAAEALKIIQMGYEKIGVGSLILENPREISRIANEIGAQGIVGCLDYFSNTRKVSTPKSLKEISSLTIEDWCSIVNELNIGEVYSTDIQNEGSFKGLNIETVNMITSGLTFPHIASGGISSISEIEMLFQKTNLEGVGVGSLFSYFNQDRTVLINYPDPQEKASIIHEDISSAVLDFEPELISILVDSNIEVSRICSKCVTTDDVPGSNLENSHLCYYCELHDKLDSIFPNTNEGLNQLKKWAENVKEESKNCEYDVIVGVSGGTDSSYLCYLLKSLNLRILAVHFDNTWNSPTASRNIFNVLKRLNIKLLTYIVDNKEYDDLYSAFLRSGVKDIESPTDIGFMGVLYRIASKYKIKHIAEGHSFRTEGVAPMRWSYMDGGYIKDVHKKFGKNKLKSYPNISFGKFIYWTIFGNIKRTRPLYWIDYDKERAKKFLIDSLGWSWYGGHHLENYFTAFYFSYFLPKRYEIDYRQIEFSALIRSGQLSKAEAIKKLKSPRMYVKSDLHSIQARLKISPDEFETIMSSDKLSYKDFKTYKKRFEILRPIFKMLMSRGIVPESFYEKYCKPDTSEEIRNSKV